MTGFGNPELIATSGDGATVCISDDNLVLILKRHENGTYYTKQAITLANNVSSLEISEDSGLLIAGTTNGVY